MMKQIFLYGLIAVVLMYSTTVFSHQPNQLTYTFRLKEDVSTLTIHFTPKTVLDILEFLNPELKSATKINLNAYQKDLSQYFGERISLNEDNLNGKLVVGETNLVSHDAYITFVLEDSVDFSKGFKITVNSLTDIYSRLENFVFVKYQGSTARYVLSNKERNAVWKHTRFNADKQLGFMGIPTSGLILCVTFIGFSLYIYFSKRSTK
nr:hypothetical protein [Allomuricauda sp.]